MGEFFFGTGRRPIKAREVKRIDKIAQAHGACFVCARLPEGWRSWFAAPNRGAPFDGQTEAAVWRALQAAGLADDNGLSEEVYK